MEILRQKEEGDDEEEEEAAAAEGSPATYGSLHSHHMLYISLGAMGPLCLPRIHHSSTSFSARILVSYEGLSVLHTFNRSKHHDGVHSGQRRRSATVFFWWKEVFKES